VEPLRSPLNPCQPCHSWCQFVCHSVCLVLPLRLFQRKGVCVMLIKCMNPIF
jgi:hypothetical protein